MMVSKRNLLFQGLIFRFHIKLQGYIQTSFQIYTRWPGEKRRSLRGIGSHEDDHAVEGGAWGEQVSQGMGIPKNSQGCQGNLQIIHRFGWLGGGLVYVLCSKVFGVTIVGEFLDWRMCRYDPTPKGKFWAYLKLSFKMAHNTCVCWRKSRVEELTVRVLGKIRWLWIE